MRPLTVTALLLACVATGAADNALIMVSKMRIKVQLFASPSFISEVSVDVNNGVCLSLDNNLYADELPWHTLRILTPCRIDGQIQSILVGGHDVTTVYQRNDWWSCRFFEYVS